MVEQLPVAPGPGMFEVVGQFSMTSDSPTVGQETPRCEPSIQKAGHSPACEGIWILASIRPEWKLCRPWVLRRADVQVFPTDRTWMARWPLPSTYALGELELHGEVFEVGAQYVSSSLFPKPPAPVSYVHFVGSIG